MGNKRIRCNLSWKSTGDRGSKATPSRHRVRVIWIAALSVCFVYRSHCQISPGPLAKVHQGLSGNTNCTKCHEVSAKAASFRCLECHKEIAAELSNNQGLHATFPRGGVPSSACVKCHSDHNGVDYPMIHWDPTPKGFDHLKTGYALDGKHVDVSCRACHNMQHIVPAKRNFLSAKDLNRTWMGLTPTCASCHQDPHQGRFGSNCAQCHSTSGWNSARVARETFDHSKTLYPLTGTHRSVLCQSCHTLDASGQPRWSGLKFASCSDCHADPHKGEFKPGCDSCHTTVTWKKSSFAERFNHADTGFPLLGKHADVACVTCHQGEDFKKPLPHQVCADCHTRDDPHGGQFAKRPDGEKCESCHTVSDWSPSTFSVTDHAKTGFPLVFPHENVKCDSCHVRADKATQYEIKFALCVDCHKDEHEGQFAGQPWLNHCEKCHNDATFKTTSYTLAKHQKSFYPLIGSHAAVACDQCHKAAAESTLVLYHFKQLSCTTCHENVHKGEFADRMAETDRSGKPLGCEACHSIKVWEDLSKFNHDQTRFPLSGSHRAVACADCHKPPNLEMTMIHVRFSSASSVCVDCHENPHADQFGARAKDCASCHSSNKWKPSLFDHEKTSFSLKGAHEDVPCASCHTTTRPVDDKLVLFYKPTPTACSSCHGANIPEQKESSSERKQLNGMEQAFILPQVASFRQKMNQKNPLFR